MKLSVVGYPRIGTLRELKFVSEAYFKHTIEQTELKQTANRLRKTHWKTQLEYHTGSLSKVKLISVGYLFCNGKGISGRTWRCKSIGDEEMVSHQLSLYRT